MLPPIDPKADPGPDTDDLDQVDAGWDPYVASLLASPALAPAVGEPDDGAPVMSFARVEDRRRR